MARGEDRITGVAAGLETGPLAVARHSSATGTEPPDVTDLKLRGTGFEPDPDVLASLRASGRARILIAH